MRTDRHVRNLASSSGFRKLLAVRLTSQAADGMFQASLALSVFFNPALGDNTRPFTYAAAVALLLGPYSLLGPYVGVVLDRFSRRNLIGAANILRAALVFVIALTLQTGLDWTWVLCAMVVLAANRFVLAGLGAAHPHVIAEPELVTANSLASTLGAMAYGLGLAMTGIVRLVFDSEMAYSMLALAAGLGYLASAAIVSASFRAHSIGPDAHERTSRSLWKGIASTTSGMIEGLLHLRHRRGPALAMALQGIHRLFYGIAFIIAIALFMGFFWDVESDPSRTTTISWLLVLAVLGNVGVFVAAVITPRATRHWGPKNWVVVLMALCAVVMAALAGTMRPVMFAVAVLLVNIASQGVKITVDTSIQRGVDDTYRGRVFSLNDTVYNVGYLAGLFAAALVVPTDGYAPGTLAGVAIAYGLICVGYAYLARDDAPYDSQAWSPATPEPRPSTSR